MREKIFAAMKERRERAFQFRSVFSIFLKDFRSSAKSPVEFNDYLGVLCRSNRYLRLGKVTGDFRLWEIIHFQVFNVHPVRHKQAS